MSVPRVFVVNVISRRWKRVCDVGGAEGSIFGASWRQGLFFLPPRVAVFLQFSATTFDAAEQSSGRPNGLALRVHFRISLPTIEQTMEPGLVRVLVETSY
jgi:hypothetical protein